MNFHLVLRNLVIRTRYRAAVPASRCTSSTKARMSNRPRPDWRSRFSSASGSGRFAKSKPSPSSVMVTVNRSGIVLDRRGGPSSSDCSDCRGQPHSPSLPARPFPCGADRLRENRPGRRLEHEGFRLVNALQSRLEQNFFRTGCVASVVCHPRPSPAVFPQVECSH